MTQASYLGKKKVSVKVHLLNAAFTLLVWKKKNLHLLEVAPTLPLK